MMPTTIDPAEKFQTIDLDCSTRAKIVIRTKLPTSNRPTVFTSMSQVFKLETPVQDQSTPVSASAQHIAIPSRQPPRPSSSTIKMLSKAKTIEDSKVKKQGYLPHQSPTTERKVIPLPSRLRISSAPNSSSCIPINEPEPEPDGPSLPILSIPIPNRPSKYTEEYDKCPCTRGRASGKPPCDRCQLMLLADRFCELIDVQCQKWGIPPKHRT